jgi:hypothetical protein
MLIIRTLIAYRWLRPQPKEKNLTADGADDRG